MFKQTLWYSHISTVMFLLLKTCVMASLFALVESEQHESDGVGGRTRFQRYFEDADLPPGRCSYTGQCTKTISYTGHFGFPKTTTFNYQCQKEAVCATRYFPWSACTQTCDTGFRRRIGRCDGRLCDRWVREEETCNTQGCDGPTNWNDLLVTWAQNPSDPNTFDQLPRTRADAQAQGWVNMAPGTACEGNPLFRGERYLKDNDSAVILIYDVNGYIAGIQAGFPQNYPDNPNMYPNAPIVDKPMVLDGNFYYVTAYFVNPSIICNGGRTAAEFESQGTGVGLWVQNGTDPISDSMKIPYTQAEVDNTLWTEGACFPTMGVHYWYNNRQDMPCSECYPVFLMYNNGTLNSFGWAFGINLQESPRFEHPPPPVYPLFLNPVPDCLSGWGTITTLHIYLITDYFNNNC